MYKMNIHLISPRGGRVACVTALGMDMNMNK